MSATDRTEWLPGGIFETHRIERGIRGLFAVLGVYRRPFLASLLWACLNAGSTMASFTLGAYIVGRSLQGTVANDLVPWIVALGAVVLIRALASWLESWISHELAFRILAEIRGWLYRATARIAPGGLARRRTGELASVALADAEALEVFYAHTSLYLFTAAVMTPLAVGVLAVFDPVVALIAGGLCLLTVVIPVLLRRLNQRSGAAVRSALADIHTFVVEHVGGLREVLAFGRREAAGAELQRLTRRLVGLQMRHGARTGLEAAFTASVAGLGLVAAAWYSAARVAEGLLDPALYPVVVVLAGQATLPALNLVGVTRHWGLTASAANRVFDLLEEPSPIERDGTGRVVGHEVPEVRVEDVTFTWPDTDRPALIDVSVRLTPGESLAIVGHSGAGKSTLAALLARFFDPDRGRITVGGVGLAQLDPHEMSRLVSLVPQDVFLFHDTVRANLLLGSPSDDVTEAELWAALETANAAPLIRSLPQGLDTIVGERGAALSGGERQRIALARTVLRGSPVLVLDESVSQLDVLSEHEIAEALRGVRTGRSTVIIAHRLSTVLAADRILLLAEGRVVASGTHQELLASCPEYLRLVGAQLSQAPDDSASEIASLDNETEYQ
jgi:ATP-binding cassette, subfamily C, bacterial CydC